MEKVNGKQRVAYIDSLRGMACVLVILNHISCCFLPGLMWYKYADSYLSRIWLGSPLNVITNGNTAVQFFFVISGYLITANISESNAEIDIFKTIIGKIKKSFLITTPSILFAFILMRFNLMFNKSTLQYGERYFFAGQFNDFSPTLQSLLRDILRVLVVNSDYNRPLGFIATSLIGGVFTVLLASALKNTDYKRKTAVCAVLFFIIIWNYQKLSGFCLGSLCYYCGSIIKREHTYIALNFKNTFMKSFVFLIALYIMTYQDDAVGIYAPLSFLTNYDSVIRATGVTIFVFWLEIYGENTKKILSNLKIIKFLGRLSPYVYSYHWPITLSVGCWMFILLQTVGRGIRAVIIAVFVTLISVIMAFLTTKMCGILKNRKVHW